MQNRSLEREIKLEVPANFNLPDLDAAYDGVTAHPRGARRYATTYYDTTDLRLARWGCSLRYRDGQGWTLKLPEPSDGEAAMFRTEYVFDGPAGAPPAAALDLVASMLRRARVRVVARLNAIRRTIDLRSNGEALAEVTDDVVSVLRANRVLRRFREIEIELAKDGPLTLLDAVAARLQAAGAGAPHQVPKVVQALGSRAAGPAEVAAVEPDPDGPASAVISFALARSVERLIRHDPLIRASGDVEAVHQARVATRRLRSDLRTFRPLLKKSWSDSLRRRLRAAADALGAVRDADVFIERLNDAIAKLPVADRVEAGAVVGDHAAERARRYEALLAVLRSDAYLGLLDELIEGAARPQTLRSALRAARLELPALVADQWKKAKRAATSAQRLQSDDALHRLRIRIKRCRYAMDAVAPVAGKRAKAFAKAAGKLQQMLGTHHDAVVAHGLLREYAKHGAAFAAGELAMIEWRAAGKTRKSWLGGWQKVAAARQRLGSWS